MAFHLGKIHVGAGALLEERARVVEQIEPEVHEARRGRCAVHEEVALGQMPATRPPHQGRRAVVQPVRLARDVQRERSAHRIHEILLSRHDVRPRGGAGVLQIGHEDARTGVEGVDHHLPVHRPGDLDAAVGEVGRSGRNLPCRLAHRRRLGGKVEGRARRMRGQLAPTLGAPGQDRLAAWGEGAVQRRHECQGVRSEDRTRAGDVGSVDHDRLQGRVAHGDWLRRRRVATFGAAHPILAP